MNFGKYVFAGVVLFMLALANPVWSMTEVEFAACVTGLKSQAQERGISQGVVDTSLARVKLSERVLELDKQQPEFTTTFASYFERRVTEQRVQQGRALIAEHKALFDRISRDYDLPAQYLVAFWGLETNFGSFFGRMQVLDSLATLACDPRRSGYFADELMAALNIIDEGAITPERMEGSWAGAMGHVQFMPSVFLRYAVDYDKDGRRDLWGSVPDAMASAANFLRGLGWDQGTRWGREVRLPEEFPYLEAGLKNRRTLSEWHQLGVRQANGATLPKEDMAASLLVPAGHKGPAFLVYDNFSVIMRWNRSEFYGLAVGQLADRIAWGEPLRQPPPEDAPRLRRDHVIELQEKLNARGFDSGEPDGILGPATRRAISEFQHDQGMTADGFPGRQLLALLDVAVDGE